MTHTTVDPANPLHRFTCEVYVVEETDEGRKAVWVQCRCDEVAAVCGSIKRIRALAHNAGWDAAMAYLRVSPEANGVKKAR